MPASPLQIAGLVLAAGRSSRFGSEKALAELGGQSLLSRAVAALSPHTARIAVSASEGEKTAALAHGMGLAVIHDRTDIAVGPLAGILSGLHWANTAGAHWLLSLPCDTALLPLGAIERLLAAADRSPAAYATTQRGAESLCAIWPVSCAGRLEALLTRGMHPPVREFLEGLGAVPVAFEEENAFFNINTRADLARAETLLGDAPRPVTS